ncbi:LexA family protein [Lysinibacillus xylanilyticus]|uniref:LexA family protein n=1 Tax=Lysinibacillus xylanilyticus TaxID=582475 RepID=UPI0036DB8753
MSDKEMENIISRNLKKIIRDYQITQNELAKIAGVSESAAGKWILGKSTPRMGAIQKIADYFNLPKSYILNEEALPKNLIEFSPATIKIPILGEIACGDPITAEENLIGYRYESPDNLPSGKLMYLQAKGDSMEPTIPNGSYVLIREQPEVENGEIAAVLVNGDTEATLKRVKRQGDTIFLMPDNPKHEAYIITDNNPARIIGKAIRFTQDL